MKQDQNTKREDVLIKCVTSLASLINNIIFLGEKIDFYFLNTWGELPSVQRRTKGVSYLFLYWQLIYFWFTLIALVLPLRSLWFFFNQRPFSFWDSWFFSPKPSETSENSTWLIIFSDTNFTLGISSCFIKSGLKVWVNFSHLLFSSPSTFSLWVISWGFRRDLKTYFVQFIDISNNLAYYFWIWDSIQVTFSLDQMKINHNPWYLERN